MTAFMVDTWGLTVTQEAKDTVAAMALPGWMPVVGDVGDVDFITLKEFTIALAAELVTSPSNSFDNPARCPSTVG